MPFKNIADELVEVEKDSDEECKGKVYRYWEEMFIGKNGDINYKDKFTPMKSMSCPGCKECGWMEDYMKEDLENGIFPEFDDLIDTSLCKLVPSPPCGCYFQPCDCGVEFRFEKITIKKEK